MMKKMMMVMGARALLVMKAMAHSLVPIMMMMMMMMMQRLKQTMIRIMVMVVLELKTHRLLKHHCLVGRTLVPQCLVAHSLELMKSP